MCVCVCVCTCEICEFKCIKNALLEMKVETWCWNKLCNMKYETT